MFDLLRVLVEVSVHTLALFCKVAAHCIHLIAYGVQLISHATLWWWLHGRVAYHRNVVRFRIVRLVGRQRGRGKVWERCTFGQGVVHHAYPRGCCGEHLPRRQIGVTLQ